MTGAVIELPVVKAGLRFLLARNGQRKTHHLHSIVTTTVTVGRHWVRLAPDKLERLLALRCQLEPSSTA